jgi:hypothetical protein
MSFLAFLARNFAFAVTCCMLTNSAGKTKVFFSENFLSFVRVRYFIT